MTKAEAWDGLVELVNVIDIQGILAHNGNPMAIFDPTNVHNYRNALISISAMITVYGKIVEQSEEEQHDGNSAYVHNLRTP